MTSSTVGGGGGGSVARTVAAKSSTVPNLVCGCAAELLPIAVCVCVRRDLVGKLRPANLQKKSGSGVVQCCPRLVPHEENSVLRVKAAGHSASRSSSSRVPRTRAPVRRDAAPPDSPARQRAPAHRALAAGRPPAVHARRLQAEDQVLCRSRRRRHPCAGAQTRRPLTGGTRG